MAAEKCRIRRTLEIVGVHPGCFWQRVRKLLKSKEMRFALCKEWQRAKV